MPDLFDDDISVDEFALPGDEDFAPPEEGAATAEQATTPEPETAAPVQTETAVDETAEGRPRNADGTFAAKQPDEEPQTAEETPAETAERLLAGKFKTADELESAYAELQSLTGRQGQELGQYRQWYEQQQQSRTQQPTVDPAALQERLYENPHEVIPMIQQAHAAALRGDQSAAAVRNAALATLREMNAPAAEEWSQWVIQSGMAAQQQQQAQQQSQLDGEWNSAAQQFATTHPDMDKFAPGMMELVGQYPNMLRILESGDPAAKVEVLDFLYAKARGQTSDTLSSASKEVAREQALAADEAIREATVASAATSVPSKEPTDQEKMFAEWDRMESRLTDGWNI